jgi:glyoxylase-like metal-dependent hydrolase (beta-lactamase superfamily II)
MSSTKTWTVGSVSITRVGEPGFELLVPQNDATTATLRNNAQWLAPEHVTDDWTLRLGSSALLVQTGDTTMLVDPWLAFDDPGRAPTETTTRIDARLAALADAGVAADDVDLVVNTHIDAVGANTRPAPVNDDNGNGEVAAFANARYVFSKPEWAKVVNREIPEATALSALEGSDRLDVVEGPTELAPGITIEPAPGHNAGHMAVWIESGGDGAVIPGHLFLHPAQIYDPAPRDGLDEDPPVAAQTRTAILERCTTNHWLLVGPLFAPPGGGRVEMAAAGHWRLR